MVSQKIKMMTHHYRSEIPVLEGAFFCPDVALREEFGMRLRVRSTVFLAWWVVGLFAVGCQEGADMKSEEGEMPKQAIEEVLRSHTSELMAIPGVVGTYMGAADDGTQNVRYRR